jgi:hypothetical protein
MLLGEGETLVVGAAFCALATLTPVSKAAVTAMTVRAFIGFIPCFSFAFANSIALRQRTPAELRSEGAIWSHFAARSNGGEVLSASRAKARTDPALPAAREEAMAWINDEFRWEPGETSLSVGRTLYWLATIIAAIMVIFAVADLFIGWAQGAPIVRIVALVAAAIVWLIGRFCRSLLP